MDNIKTNIIDVLLLVIKRKIDYYSIKQTKKTKKSFFSFLSLFEVNYFLIRFLTNLLYLLCKIFVKNFSKLLIFRPNHPYNIGLYNQYLLFTPKIENCEKVSS